uniref:Uncharacterized protein n=1 Tax=Panagrolaimus sp. ES5 TaxID=591445 RepID=A0AC34FML6_9BILA
MPNDTKYKQYPWRWYVLTVTCLLALTNAAIWISFSAVGAHVNVFYCDESYFEGKQNVTKFPKNVSLNNSKNVTCEVAYWNGQIFQIVGCIGGLIGIFITDKYGILVSTYCASILNFIGIILRTISAIPSLDHFWRLHLLFVGQTFAACAQPFFLVLSPKVAENWFSDNQRAFANAISFAANPAGVVLGTVAPELILHKDFTVKNDSGLLWLNTLLLGFGTTVMMLTFGMRSALPPSPPSASSHIGYASALSAIAGCISSLLAGCYVDKTKKFSQVLKISSVGVALTACLINVFIRHHQGSIWDYLLMGFLLMLLGFFSM